MFNKVESSMFAIKPEPNSGVGMRKIRLLAAAAWAKPGCGKPAQVLPGAKSARPAIVNMVSTPPFGLLTLAVPLALKKNGKRASRTGPFCVIKDGRVLVVLLATPLEMIVN